MRILVATDQWFPDLKGGLARVATETAARLAGRGHEVHVIAPAVPNLPAESREGNLTIRRVLRRRGLPQTLADPVGTWLATRSEELRQYDLVVAHVSTAAVGLVAARSPVPLAYVFHASASRELRDLRQRLTGRRARATTYALAPVLRGYERLAVRGAKRILVLSEFSRTLVGEDHPGAADRVRLVSGAVDVDSFTPGEGMSDARSQLGVRPEAQLLLTVRRLEPRMGIEQLLRSLAAMSEAPGLELVVAGGGSLAKPLHALAAELGVADRVRFAGRVSDEDLRTWYRAADLFVLPTQAYEGFGMVTAEALASGTPVVGTPIGATPELLAPLDPRLVASGSGHEALATAIRAGLDLGGERFRRRCREYACTRFSWAEAIVGWEQALQEAAAA